MAHEAGSGSSSSEALGFSPTSLIDEVFNVVRDYVADAADTIEHTLSEHPELGKNPELIKQGVDRWQLKMLRAADDNFDKFELYTLKNVFAVPDNLQLAPPEAEGTAESAQLDAETDALWAQLQQALATKRELQRKLTAAQTTTAHWEVHRQSVQQLAASQRADGVENALQGVQQLSRTLQDGWQLVRSSDGTGAARAPAVAGPRGALQRYSQRRAQITTASVPDLLQLSSLLTAS